ARAGAAGGAGAGTDDRPPERVGRPAVGGEMTAQLRRQAVAHRIAGFAVDDHRDHPLGAVHRIETADVLVDLPAGGGGRRAQHDQKFGRLQRRQVRIGRGIVAAFAAAKDRAQGLRYCADRGGLANQALVDAERCQLAGKPPAPDAVMSAVTQEDAVLYRTKPADATHSGRNLERSIAKVPFPRWCPAVGSACSLYFSRLDPGWSVRRFTQAKILRR